MLTGSVLLAICLVFTFVLMRWYGDVGLSLGVANERLSAAVAQEVDRNIELLDFSLQGISKQWGSAEVRALPPKLRDLVLFDNALRAPGFGTILVLDQNGATVADSTAEGPVGPSYADRDYFRVHVDNRNVGLFVSKPFRSRLSGQWIVALSRRIEGSDGDFRGVVIGTLYVDYLTKLYQALGIAQGNAVTLFRTDGTIITREPFVAADVRMWAGGGDSFNRMRASKSGTFEGPSPIDSRDKIFAFHRLGSLPLIQAVESSGDDDYADWWRRASAIAVLLGILCLGSLLLSLTLHREVRRRSSAERELARIAATDELTGLANRRQFRLVLAGAWSRAALMGEPLALLMIDADEFKAYNDLFGHHGGDKILQAIAGQLDMGARRHGGLACRYGGEEFVVLLTGSDEGSALAVASEIRHSVQALGLSHPRSAEKVVTISIGVSSGRPSDGGSLADLMAAADEAVYLAKAEGRNRCRSRALVRPQAA